jgi:hypothetical protein
MITWTPVFSKLVNSSVWSEPDFVCKVFITLLALKDADHVVRHTAYALGRLCWPGDPEGEARVLKALKILESPDRKRIEPQPYEGRRIEKVEGGWLMLNGQFYEDLMRSVNRKAYKAVKQAEYRERNGKPPRRPKKVGPLPGEVAALKAEARGDHEGAAAIVAEAELVRDGGGGLLGRPAALVAAAEGGSEVAAEVPQGTISAPMAEPGEDGWE